MLSRSQSGHDHHDDHDNGMETNMFNDSGYINQDTVRDNVYDPS